MEQYIMNEMNYRIDVIKPIIKQISKAINDEEQIYLKAQTRPLKILNLKAQNLQENL